MTAHGQEFAEWLSESEAPRVPRGLMPTVPGCSHSVAAVLGSWHQTFEYLVRSFPSLQRAWRLAPRVGTYRGHRVTYLVPVESEVARAKKVVDFVDALALASDGTRGEWLAEWAALASPARV